MTPRRGPLPYTGANARTLAMLRDHVHRPEWSAASRRRWSARSWRVLLDLERADGERRGR